jgi:hypothetical protein
MAYEFNGTNQYISTAAAPVAAVPLTIACWFNSKSITANQRLVRLYSTAGLRPYWDISARGADAGDPVGLAVYDGVSAQVTLSTTSYSANTWHHACGVFTSATSRTIYLDAGGSATGTTNLTPNQTINASIIGVFIDSSGNLSQYFNGNIAEVGIWNAALTAAEIASLAKGMTCDKIRPQNLVFYAPLVRDLNDQKGGLVITNNNGATVANHPRVYA